MDEMKFSRLYRELKNIPNNPTEQELERDRQLMTICERYDIIIEMVNDKPYIVATHSGRRVKPRILLSDLLITVFLKYSKEELENILSVISESEKGDK